MDKYDIVLDIIEHPDKYSGHQVEEILSDHETKEIYRILCLTASGIAANADDDVDIDVDAEWERLSKRNRKSLIYRPWLGSRAASIVAITFTSLAAAAIGVAVVVKSIESRQESSIGNAGIESTTATGDSNIAIQARDTIAPADKTPTPSRPIIFEDETLEVILNHIAERHNAVVEYHNPEMSQLHLYYRFDPSLSLRETIGQLNTFEQININISGEKLIVD